MKRINENEYLFEDVPVLIIYDDLESARNRGCILFFHGFFGSKESNIDILRNLAEDGYIVVGVDNYGHGKRKLENFGEVFSDKNPNIEENFLNAVIKTAHNVPSLIDELIKRNFAREDKIGMAGISMGGYITYTAITIDTRIKTAVSIIGSPKYKLNIPESPHNHIDKFNKVHLLSQNVTNDSVVPTKFTSEFHEKLKIEYKDYSSRFNYIEYPKSDHMMVVEEWEWSVERLREWFKKHLK